MTKPQALAMLAAMEGANIPGSVVLAFPQVGVPSYQVALDTSHIYTGVQLGQVASYCAQNGLTLSAQVSNMGVT